MYLNKSEACERIGLQEWVLDAMIRDDQIRALKVDDGSVLFRSEDVDALKELVFTQKSGPMEVPPIETVCKGNGEYEPKSLSSYLEPADPPKPVEPPKKKGTIVRPNEVGVALQVIASRCRLSVSVGKAVTAMLGWVTGNHCTIYPDPDDPGLLNIIPLNAGPLAFYGNGSLYGKGERNVPMLIRVTIKPSGRTYLPMSRREFTVSGGGRLSVSLPEEVRELL